MNLIIDIGNTHAKLVAFDGDTLLEEMCTSNKTLEALPTMLGKHSFERAIIATVADISPAAEAMLSRIHFPTLRFTPEVPIPLITIQYRTPHTLGTDRIGAAVGAFSQKPGNDILVVDVGTCITYEFIDRKGRYEGGNISPGLRMRLEALNMKTDRLPLVNYKGEVPDMGFDTETAIRSGVLKGIKFEIEGYINAFAKKYPSLLVFLTGGGCLDFDSTIKNTIFVDKYLVARGLNVILQHNTSTDREPAFAACLNEASVHISQQ